MSTPPPHKRPKVGDRTWMENEGPTEFLTAALGINETIANDTIALLKTKGISSLGMLKGRMDEEGVWEDKFFMELLAVLGSSAVQKLRNHVLKVLPAIPIEDVLNGKFLRLQNGQPLEAEISRSSGYQGGAASFRPPQIISLREGHDIRFVLGPSGSGKTMFAVNGVATDHSIEKKPCSKKVCFYLDCGKVHSTEVKSTGDKFTSDIERMLKGALKKASKGQWQEKMGEEPQKLHMILSVVLDEAGSLGELLGSIEVLTDICTKMSNLAANVRLIIAGTGYDRISKGISSTTSAMKYRMRPWRVEHFRAFASSEDATNIKGDIRSFIEALIRHPVLSQLTTNGRAALFVVTRAYPFWLRNMGSNHPLRGVVGTVVNLVIEDYIAANGLSSMTFAQRRRMAWGVMHELNQSSMSYNIPRFPVFSEIDDKIKEKSPVGTADKNPEEIPAARGEVLFLRWQALSVVDVHVESIGNAEVFVDDWKRSVSVSPALSMLLFNMLGLDATIYDNWRGFELKTALYAAYREVLKNQETQTKGVRLAQLTMPIPAPGATKNIRLPRVGTVPTVFVNGEKAPFFDVVSKTAGYHSRYSKKGDTVTFNVDQDMQKTGALAKALSSAPEDEKAFTMGNAAMAGFRHAWAAQIGPSTHNPTARRVALALSGSLAFPLPLPETPEVEEAEDVSKFETVSVDDRRLEPYRQFKKAYTVNFVTNAKSINLETRDGKIFTVKREDVDVKGDIINVMKDKALEELFRGLKLKSLVRVRFIFTEGAAVENE